MSRSSFGVAAATGGRSAAQSTPAAHTWASAIRQGLRTAASPPGSGTADRDHGDHDHRHDHGDHSGYGTGTQRMDVLQAIFAESDFRAAANREVFETGGVRALNMMSSPGSGKTTVLEVTLDEVAGEIAVRGHRG